MLNHFVHFSIYCWVLYETDSSKMDFIILIKQQVYCVGFECYNTKLSWEGSKIKR